MTETKRHLGFFLVGIGKKVLLFHRHAKSDSTRLLVSFSHDGTTFTPKRITSDFSKIGKKGKPFGNATSFRAGQLGKKIFLTFFDHDEDTLKVLLSDSGTEWTSIIKKNGFGHPAVLVETDSDKNHTIAVFSSSGRKFITLSLTNEKFLKWNHRGVVLEARPKSFDVSALSPLSAIRTKQGIVLVYTAKNRDGHITIGAAIFDAKQPERLLWRSVSPMWTTPSDWLDTKVTVLGGANVGKYFYVYFQRKDGVIETFPMSRLWETYRPPSSVKKTTGKSTLKKKLASIVHPKIPTSVAHRLCRHEENPILEPRDENAWEAFSAFNAAAVLLDEKVHLLYRAQGHDGISILGYAMTEDGTHITERSADPVFVPSDPFDMRKKGTPKCSFPYVSGGGWGGCEDPRLTRIADRIYMTYVAFNGSCPPGVALTSIATSDFGTRWDWQTPRLISRPNQTQKNWVIFPEKIRGKYAVIHTISPEIGIAYPDSLDDPDLVIDSTPPRPKQEDANRWDNIVRGVGAPPIRTDEGWLVLYHAMDSRDPNRYKVGAMLLDFDHPEIVLARSPDPILEPEAEYENHGHKQGVVYVCGATVKEGTLFVYYGASDKTLAVATADLDRFVSSIRKAKPTKLTKIRIS
jgi:beta-1,2-mannobiose phosphorylase / 1,2-beta-oligomannan phosphorylase